LGEKGCAICSVILHRTEFARFRLLIRSFGTDPSLLPYPDFPTLLLRVHGFEFVHSLLQAMGIGIEAGLRSLTDKAKSTGA
jgi:hypothetical protein